MKGAGIEWDAKPHDPLFLMDNPGEFWIGRVVTDTKSDRKRIGHIVGFDTNAHGEFIPKIAWHDGTTTAIHPANIKLH